MAIAVPDELQESEGAGSDRALTAVCGRSGFFLLIIARADVPWSDVWRGPRPDDFPEREAGICTCGDLVAMLGCHSSLLILEYRFSVD